jgi:Tfp pilus assembly protein PilF
MNKLVSMGISVLVLLIATNAWALDWKPLHEKADTEKYDTLLAESKRNPHSPEALYMFALSCLKNYKTLEARQAFEKMLALNPESIEARWGLAELFRRNHEFERARKDLEDVIKKDPGYAPAIITLAYMFFDKREFDDSMRLGYKVIRLGRRNVDVTNVVRAYLLIGGSKGMIANQGGTWTKLVQGTQVMGYLRKAQSLQPENADVYFGLASFYCLAPGFAGGDKKKGIALLEKALALDPYLVVAYARLAQTWHRLGDELKYHIYLDKAMALDPKDSLVQKAKSMVKE